MATIPLSHLSVSILSISPPRSISNIKKHRGCSRDSRSKSCRCRNGTSLMPTLIISFSVKSAVKVSESVCCVCVFFTSSSRNCSFLLLAWFSGILNEMLRCTETKSSTTPWKVSFYLSISLGSFSDQI